MSARDDLREVADALDPEVPRPAYDGEGNAARAAALRALADRIDSLERDVADRQRALNNSTELHCLRINHGEGESQHREIQLLRAALARLDAPTCTPGAKP